MEGPGDEYGFRESSPQGRADAPSRVICRNRAVARPVRKARAVPEHLQDRPHRLALRYLQLSSTLHARPGTSGMAVRACPLVRASDLAPQRRCCGALCGADLACVDQRQDRGDSGRSDLPCHALCGALVIALQGRLAGAGALLGRTVRRRALARETLERLRLGPAPRGGRLYPPDLRTGRATRGFRVAPRTGPAS